MTVTGHRRCNTATFAVDALCDRCAIDRGVRAFTHLDDIARKVLLSP